MGAKHDEKKNVRIDRSHLCVRRRFAVEFVRLFLVDAEQAHVEEIGTAGDGRTVFGMGKQSGAHIVWDWNGTLFHDNDAIIGATNAAFGELGLAPITIEQYRALYCVPVPKFYERLLGRLPTEAEWEYAARAGSPARSPWNANLEAACTHANVADQAAARQYPGWKGHPCSDGYVYSSPVGSFEPKEFELHDMLGSVFEWVRG
ncbi:hypothetical protein B4Q13_17755, partial [Lacticaseibacillus rhamnosus]